ncbi:MAG: hypothetical protein JW798_16260, partial [Prolixibacteraceae bacterium]|nr:hypothetical protein [Prolixibacteraceae bacterium]
PTVLNKGYIVTTRLKFIQFWITFRLQNCERVYSIYVWRFLKKSINMWTMGLVTIAEIRSFRPYKARTYINGLP